MALTAVSTIRRISGRLYSALVTLCSAAFSSPDTSFFGIGVLISSGSLGDSATAGILRRDEDKWT